MNIDSESAREQLRNFDLPPLFNQLGWDLYSQTLPIRVGEVEYVLTGCAEKRGMVVFYYSAPPEDDIPDYTTRSKIEREVTKSVHEHLIIFTNHEKTTQIWQWVKREAGRPAQRRELNFDPTRQEGEALIQRLESITFSLEEEEGLTLVDVTSRVRAAFDVERVTKRFYDYFKKEHDVFLQFLAGIPDEEMQRWYVSVILNRLMFIYFIQKKGFLNDDPDYLQTNLLRSREYGADQYYRTFLCPLFFEGFAKPKNERSREMTRLLGNVPYLNGGIFQKHQIEAHHGESIQIPDAAFERLFTFFERYQWHLDDRPLKNDDEINPDVLGYIFEKYINQKQMGAYYTKEDITDYIGKNTIIPLLLDFARKNCKIAFVPPAGSNSATVWKLLVEDPDRYIYDAVKHGTELELPPEIDAGVKNVSKRTQWNTLAPSEYALPTEIWREVVARRERYHEIHRKLSKGEIHEVNDLITYNLNLRQFAQDIIENCEGPDLLRAFWKAIKNVTILDPTCGSGAFLFAALNILEPLYEACLDRMGAFVDELQFSEKKPHPKKFAEFREILHRVEQHPNRKYFILKSIIINNLYGVDIMEEAIEICKLRLFLKMVAQVDDVHNIEPLPDIDFNIQAGNTLVGYATYDDVNRAVTENKIDFDNVMNEIEEKAEDVEILYKEFQEQQTKHGGRVTPTDKQNLQEKLTALAEELNRYLAEEYKVHPKKEGDYQEWLSSHKPLHWFTEFYAILKNGGFDVIIGNPPYVKYSKVRKEYRITSYETESCGNLYTLIAERSLKLLKSAGMCSMIVPISAFSNRSMREFQEHLKKYPTLHISNFHQRPAQLFHGVLQRLSIFHINNSKIQKANIHTTSVIRWYTEAREILFNNLKYHLTPQFKQRIFKVGNNIENSILEKYRDHKEIGMHLLPISQANNNFVAYRTAGGGYWWTFLNSKFQTESLSNKIAYFANPYDARVFMATLNSSLFWWYYLTSYDLFNLKDYMIFSFQFNYPENKPLERDLIYLAERLQTELLGNAIQYRIESKTRGSSYTFTYQNSHSKSILDQIDRVLANHYGFTDEELDFIINYDIKYRMGLGSSD